MRRELLTALAVAALVVTAGCTIPGGGSSGTDGTLDVYVSDQPNAINDFQHLNVTITRIGVHRAGNESWNTRDVSRTVDLTRLQGSNASLVGALNLSTGTYTKVFIEVEGVEGTLKSGTEAEVDLSSDRLQLSKPFTITANGTVTYVYDVTVVKQGDGEYVIKPQASESGPNQPVNPVGDRPSPTTAD